MEAQEEVNCWSRSDPLIYHPSKGHSMDLPSCQQVHIVGNVTDSLQTKIPLSNGMNWRGYQEFSKFVWDTVLEETLWSSPSNSNDSALDCSEPESLLTLATSHTPDSSSSCTSARSSAQPSLSWHDSFSSTSSLQPVSRPSRTSSNRSSRTNSSRVSRPSSSTSVSDASDASCTRLVKLGLKSLSLVEKPEKCPVKACRFHSKGFARKHDQLMHTATHYKVTMSCSLCTGRGAVYKSKSVLAFQRHLTSAHAPIWGHTCGNNIVSCPICNVIHGSSQILHDHILECAIGAVVEKPNESSLKRDDPHIRNLSTKSTSQCSDIRKEAGPVENLPLLKNNVGTVPSKVSFSVSLVGLRDAGPEAPENCTLLTKRAMSVHDKEDATVKRAAKRQRPDWSGYNGLLAWNTMDTALPADQERLKAEQHSGCFSSNKHKSSELPHRSPSARSTAQNVKQWIESQDEKELSQLSSPYSSSDSTPSLQRSDSSSGYESTPASLLISRGHVFFIPDVSPADVLRRFGEAGFDINTVHAQNQRQNASRQSNTSGQIFNDPLACRSSKITKSFGSDQGSPTNSSDRSLPTKASRSRTKKVKDSQRFGCPYAKRNPSRYSKVVSSCTLPLGMEFKYVVEHLERKHSAKQLCPLCGQTWRPGESWVRQLERHMTTDPCTSREETLCKSEPMTEQELAALEQYKSDRHRNRGPEPARWTNLFMALFPNEYPIPSPFYDFFVMSHTIRQPRPSTPPDVEMLSPPTSSPPTSLFPLVLASAGLDDIGHGFDTLSEILAPAPGTGLDPVAVSAQSHFQNQSQNISVSVGYQDVNMTTTDSLFNENRVLKPSDGQESEAFLDELFNTFTQNVR